MSVAGPIVINSLDDRTATHFCTKSRKSGCFVIGRKTIKKRMRATLRAIKMELRKRMHDPIKETGAWIARFERKRTPDSIEGGHWIRGKAATGFDEAGHPLRKV